MSDEALNEHQAWLDKCAEEQGGEIMKTPLIERMTKGGAAKTWIKEVETKDREVERLEQTKDHYLNTIDLLACEKEQLEAELTDYLKICQNYVTDLGTLQAESAQLKRENEVLRKYADHKGYCRVRLRQLGDACICGYTDALLTEEHDDQT